MEYNCRIRKYVLKTIADQHYMIYPSGLKKRCYFYPCKECGKLLLYRSPNEKSKSGFCRVCGNIGHRNPNDKGLTTYPVRTTEAGDRVRQHILHYVKILGRKLKQGEQVHHIDNNHLNYSPDNLVLFANSSEHLKCHRQLEMIAFTLVRNKIIKFDHKKKTYYVSQ